MKATWSVIVPFAALCLALSACDGASWVKPKDLTFEAEDNGKIVNMCLSDILVVNLPANLSTGYSWENISAKEGPVRQEGDSVYAVDKSCADMPGCSGTETFIFKAADIGAGAIDLIYYQSWNKDPDDILERYQLTVKVKECR